MQKLTNYLLSTTHPVGRHKARFFAALGFNIAKPLALAEALKLQARLATEVQESSTPFGQKWAAWGIITGVRGSAVIWSIWILIATHTRAQLVTAYPAEEGRKP